MTAPGAALAGDVARLPDRPGVYRFRDADGRTLYVGKAKSLRSRVRSYFRPAARHGPRVARMVAAIAALDVIVVDTEIEALILEANLIKRERPPFNVVLRDDKNFPYVKISLRDEFPRASLVRAARLDGARYVGPFLPAASARQTLKVIQRHFRVATCNETFDGKRRPCLYYHLDQCLAPCAAKVGADDYRRAVEDVLLFLDGRHRDLEQSLEQRMAQASASREYERAARARDTLATVRRLAERQRMVSVGLEEQDYWALHREGEQVALQLFQMREGRVLARREFTLDGVEIPERELLETVLTQYYGEAEPPPEIYLPDVPARSDLLGAWLAERRGDRVRLRVPRRGPKRRLLGIVGKNAGLAFEARFRAGAGRTGAGLDELAHELGLDAAPRRIECFDVSNLHGSDSVASLVVWEGGRPRKSEYRTFGIRGVEGPDDTAAIAEAVTRRYRRRIEEGRALPDLVLIDGGKGQLGAAIAGLTRAGLPTLAVASIAKREELIFVAGRPEPIRLERASAALKLVQRVRDEAHRFAVSRHRRKRARRTLRTGLTDLPGIGPLRARALLREFGSLEGVRAASDGDLARIVGAKIARAIRQRYPLVRG